MGRRKDGKMKFGTKAGLLASGLVLIVSPTVAFASGTPSNPGAPTNQGTLTAAANKPNNSGEPGPGASLPAKAKAFGRFCENQSKTRVSGQKGTPFSQCVTAMAHLASGQTNSPKAACGTMTHKPDGKGGSPFSRCVSSGAKLLKNKH